MHAFLHPITVDTANVNTDTFDLSYNEAFELYGKLLKCPFKKDDAT